MYECKECGREESKELNQCPGCGAYGSFKKLDND